MFDFLKKFVKDSESEFEKLAMFIGIDDKEYNIFTNNINMIDKWVEKRCPHGTHSEWDMMPIIETDGIKEDHAYNTFRIYDKSNSYRIIFGIKELTGIDKHCEDIRNELRKKVLGNKYRNPAFEDDRYWVDNQDQGFEKVSRYEFYKFIKEKDLLDYFNFKMEELVLQHV
jgi:hypothetical protein